ncbi:MAG: SusD/RagB family nutrient-binding outer membrane lipoprotein [Bacteroidota bacterium]
MKLKLNSSIIAVLVLSMFFLSCTKDFEEINQTPDKINVEQVTVAGLFNGIAKDATAGSGALNITLLLDYTNQQAVQNVFTPYINYGGSGLWNAYYPVLYDYKKLQKLIDENPVKNSYANVKYMADILMASKTLQMLDFYGDIPYSSASLADSGSQFRHPVYDKQADVYKSVLADLKAAADGIIVDGSGQTSLGNSESFLGSDYAAWVRFANALRLRYAVRLYDKEQSLASDIINDIIGGNKPLPENQNPAALQKNNFGLWPSLVSPAIINGDFYRGFAENSISQLRLSTNVWAQVSSNNNTDGSGIFDPRTVIWFAPNNAGLWVAQPQDHSQAESGDPYPDNETRPAIGTDPGNKFAAFNIDLVISYRTLPLVFIITEADVYFLKAEIYQRGLGVAKDPAAAKTAYEAGIKSSVDFWYSIQLDKLTQPPAPTDAEMSAFLAVPSVAYDGSNDADALKKIATQAWLATLWEPAESWAIARRTGLTPKDPGYTPAVRVNKIPYPDDERTNNNANWQLATGGASPDQQAIGKVYWMP